MGIKPYAQIETQALPVILPVIFLPVPLIFVATQLFKFSVKFIVSQLVHCQANNTNLTFTMTCNTRKFAVASNT